MGHISHSTNPSLASPSDGSLGIRQTCVETFPQGTGPCVPVIPLLSVLASHICAGQSTLSTEIGGLGSLIRVGKMVMHKSVMNRVWVPSRTQALHSLDTIKTQKEEASSNSNWRVNGEERSHGIGNTGSTPDYNQQQMLEDSINEFISWSLNPSILMRAKRFPRRG